MIIATHIDAIGDWAYIWKSPFTEIFFSYDDKTSRFVTDLQSICGQKLVLP